MRRQKKEIAQKHLAHSILEWVKTRMRLMTIVLFIFGLLLESMGFLISYADNCQFIAKIILADSLKAERGIQILEEKKTLDSNDCGFKEISCYYKVQMGMDNWHKKFSEISIEEICLQKYAYENMDIYHKKPLDVKLSNGKTLNGNIDSLTKQINVSKNRKLFKIAFIIFSVGVIVSIIGFAIEIKKRNVATKR